MGFSLKYSFNRDVAAGLYKEGQSPAKIGEVLGIPPHAIAYAMKKSGVYRSVSEAQRLRFLGTSQVPSGWSFSPLIPEKAWLLGLIFSNGHIDEEGYGFSVTHGDTDVLEKINALFDGRLSISQKKGCACIKIWAARLADELSSNFALGSKKHSTMEFPLILPELLSHFVRGAFDGDGCWHINGRGKTSFSYYSNSQRFMLCLRSALVRTLGISDQCHIAESRPGQFALSYSRKVDTDRIGRWFYDNSTDAVRCRRKFAIWHSNHR